MELVPPSTEYFLSFQQSLREWGDTHQDGAGIRDATALGDPAGFSQWVEQLRAEENTPAHTDFVTCTYYWMVERGEYLGSIALRHELNDFLLARGGHIGYGVRPSARGRGLAAQALGEVLSAAHDRGIFEALVVCHADNAASRRTIEVQGGRLENEVMHEGRTLQRFWITTGRD